MIAFSSAMKAILKAIPEPRSFTFGQLNTETRRGLAMAGKLKGYVKIWRKMQRHEFWQDKPFTRGQAWLDIILNCEYREERDGEPLQEKRGEWLTSQWELADKWGWSSKRVRTFLRDLKQREMIELMTIPRGTTNRTTKGTTISLVNFGRYQSTGTTRGTKKEPHHSEETLANSGIAGNQFAPNTKKNTNVFYQTNFFTLTEELHQKFKEAYPELDLVGEYKRMAAWLESNPRKRKTADGYPRFINNWLSKASQDAQGKRQDWFDELPQ
jgi:hypothetical protein